MTSIKVMMEVGRKRTFASALAWPGWCRSGRDEQSALKVLADYGLRYARVVHNTGIDFQIPADSSGFTVVERLEGNANTDFGAPAVIADAERVPIDQVEYVRLIELLKACWKIFDTAVQRAEGKELRKGPRGGGREPEKILLHVIGADQEYLRRLAWKQKNDNAINPEDELRQTREAILNALDVAVKGGLPEQGPRGGAIWPPRYFIRRTAWHVLDHAWEIEDRIV
jgi:hypothetical protein